MAENFVEMVKEGVHLVVHPSTVDSHKRAGWKIEKEGLPAPKPPKEEKGNAKDDQKIDHPETETK